MKDKYQIGDWVVVSSEVSKLYYDENKKRQAKIRPIKYPYLAQIVGACKKMFGKYEEANMACSYGFDLDFGPDYDPPYLRIESSQIFWLVRRGMVNKPIMVRDEDCEFIFEGSKYINSKIMPWKWTNQKTWSQAEKDEQRDIMFSACRDEKGRWMKL